LWFSNFFVSFELYLLCWFCFEFVASFVFMHVVMHHLKFAILVQLLQLVLQVHNLITCGYDKEELHSASSSIDDAWFYFETMHDALILHLFEISCAYKLLGN
jgi:hypothetical protein